MILPLLGAPSAPTYLQIRLFLLEILKNDALTLDSDQKSVLRVDWNGETVVSLSGPVCCRDGFPTRNYRSSTVPPSRPPSDDWGEPQRFQEKVLLGKRFRGIGWSFRSTILWGFMGLDENKPFQLERFYIQMGKVGMEVQTNLRALQMTRHTVGPRVQTARSFLSSPYIPCLHCTLEFEMSGALMSLP